MRLEVLSGSGPVAAQVAHTSLNRIQWSIATSGSGLVSLV
jgi:hypothetical protein